MNFFARYLPLALVVVGLQGFGQTSATPAQPPAQNQPAVPRGVMPSDPAALLGLAEKENGVGRVAISPWHLKATYQLLDDHGKAKETGTIEEVWASAKVYKLIYRGPNFQQTDYSSTAGLFRTGFQQWPDYPLDLARESLFPKMPPSDWVKTQKLTMLQKTVAGDQLRCVAINSPESGAITNALVYCFNASAPNLRVSYTGYGSHETFYNNTARFGGAYVARDVSVRLAGKLFLHVHLDLLEYLPLTEQSIFIAPSGSVEITRRVSLSERVTGGKVLSSVTPEYPEEARISHEQGPVIVWTTIGTDGKVQDVKAIAGPQLLRAAAVNAIRHWTFEPYRMEGQAVEGKNELTITFWGGGDFVPFG